MAGLLLVAGLVLYELFRHHTTVAEVQNWCSTLPSDATQKDVEALFTSKGMYWVRMPAGWGCPPDEYDPSDHYGLLGRLRGVEKGFLWSKDIVVIVRFDKSNHVKSTVVNEHGNSL
jgi:hypothetical protein